MIFKEYVNKISKYKGITESLSKTANTFRNTYMKETSENSSYFYKPFYVFDVIFKNKVLFDKLKSPFSILGVGDNRGAFLSNNVVVKVNITQIDENKAEKTEIVKLEKIPHAKYFVIPLLAHDTILGQTIVYFPKCENINLSSLSEEQKIHLELVKSLFIDTTHIGSSPTKKQDDLTEKNIMQLGNGIVCIDVQTGTTNAIHTIESNELFKKLSQTQYWKEWTRFIDTFN